MKELLSICIPTYNRAALLQSCLENLLPLAKKYEIPVYVSDNASTDNTKEVIEKLQMEHPLLHYFRNAENLFDYNYGLVLRMSNSQYSWLFNDKSRLTEEIMKNVLDQLKSKEYTLLILNAADINSLALRVKDVNGPVIYTDKNKLLKDLGWHMTMVGSTIWSKTMIEKSDFKKYLSSPFLQLQTLLNYLSDKEIHVYWDPKLFFLNLPILSGWAKGKNHRIFDFFVEKWINAIQALPDTYSKEAKDTCIKDHGIKSGLFSYDNFVRFKKAGQYNYKTFKKYADLWPRITDVPKWKLFLIAVLPPILV